MTLIPTRDQPPRLAAPASRPVQPLSAGPAAGIGARQILSIIRKRKWLIILTFAICVGVVCIATLLWWLYLPIYRAEAYLKVSPPPATIIQAGQTPIYGKEIIERYKRSWAALVKHQRVWNLAIEPPENRITGKRWYEKYKEDIFEELDDAIKVSVMPETEFIRLSMDGLNKEELADIVNAVAAAFVKFAAEAPTRERAQEINRLDEQGVRLRTRLANIQRETSRLIAGSPMAALPERRSLAALSLEMLAREVGLAEIEQAEAASAMQAHQQEVQSGTMSKNPRVLQVLDIDFQLRSLEVRKAELQTNLENAVRKFGPKHRTLLGLRSVIEATERQIEARRNEIVQSEFEKIGQERHLFYAVATQRLADLKENRLAKAKVEAQDLEESLGRIESLRQQAEDIQENLRRIEQAVLDRQILVSGAAGGEIPQTRPVTLWAPATLPRKPVYPPWEVMVALGIVLGLVLGFGLAFLLELADTSVKSPSDIARRVDLPLLGMVPHSDDLDEEIKDFRRVALEAPHSLAAEAFRQIRTNLLFSGPAGERRSLLVTSPAPEDGRTTVVVSLAVSMAQAGKRVLVVDANFRQPAIAEIFPAASQDGLSSAVVGQAAWRDVVSPTDVPNLFVMTSGPLPPNPAELLGSDAMRRLVSEMASEYDQVIFDGSPAMLVADARVLSTQVDGVIVVVRAGSNNVGMVQKTAEQLNRIGAHLMGVVLQGVRTTAGGYLRKNYETFYEYHQRALP